MSKIFIFGGGKGGVGKTTACLAFVLSARAKGIEFAVREGDATNPDVARALGLSDDIIFQSNDMASWATILQEARSGDIVINLPGGGDKELLENAGVFATSADEEGHQVFFISSLNRSRECLLLLKDTLDALVETSIKPVVIINELFKEASKFTRYYKSKMREKLQEMSGVECILPELQDFSIDAMMSKGGKDFETADRLTQNFYKAWLTKAGKEFEPLLK